MKKIQYFIGILAMAFLLVQGVMDITNYFSSDSQPTMEMGQAPSMGQQNGDNISSSANASGDTSTSSDSSAATDDAAASSDVQGQQGQGQMTPPSGDFSGKGPQAGGNSGFNSIHQGTKGLITGIVLVVLSGAGLVFTAMSGMNRRKEA